LRRAFLDRTLEALPEEALCHDVAERQRVEHEIGPDNQGSAFIA
jgi:hypothetical protein